MGGVGVVGYSLLGMTLGVALNDTPWDIDADVAVDVDDGNDWDED